MGARSSVAFSPPIRSGYPAASNLLGGPICPLLVWQCLSIRHWQRHQTSSALAGQVASGGRAAQPSKSASGSGSRPHAAHCLFTHNTGLRMGVWELLESKAK